MASPTVTAVSPGAGTTVGSAITIILGTNFTTATDVTFGGISADFEVISATRIYAVTPARSVGSVDVVVTNPDGSGTGTGLYEYEAPVDPPYYLYLFDDCCHIWISQNTGQTFEEGCTPGNSSTPAPNDPGLDPYGIGTITDPWNNAQMAINDGDYLTIAASDDFYNEAFTIIGISPDAGRNQTWTLIDPEVGQGAFISDYSLFQAGFDVAINSGAETILVPMYRTFASDPPDNYPRISRDGGATWSNVTGVSPNIRWARAAFGSTDSQIMYLSSSTNFSDPQPAYVWKSTDWGVTWAPLLTGPDAQSDSYESESGFCCSADGQVVIRSEVTGHLWLSQDGGTTWVDINFDEDFDFTSSNRFSDCCVTPDGQTIIVCFEQTLYNGSFFASWPAVFISTDGGDNFSEVTDNLLYPATAGPPSGSAPSTNPTGCTQCCVSPDGLGMVVTFAYTDAGITQPNGLAGYVLYANVSVDAGATFKLVAFNADPYQNASILGLFTGIYITPEPPVPPPEPPPMPPADVATTGRYFIERMDNRIWPTIEDAWCLDAALEYPMPEPDATLFVSSATGDHQVTEYNIINGGSGYVSPIAQVTDIVGGGSGASLNLGLTGGVITSATPSVFGAGYLHPTVSVLDSVGSGAVIQAVITNYVTATTTVSTFTSSDEGSIIRVGGGMMMVVSVASATSVVANIISPIAQTIQNDPGNTPIPAAPGQWSMTTPTMTVSGLWHLEGMTVAALADGGVVTDLEVENGSVTLPYEATQILVGLPFVAQAQTMYLDAGAGPTVQGRRKDVTQVVLRVEGSRPPEVGMNQPDAAAQPNQAEVPWGASPYTSMTQIVARTPTIPAGQPVPLFSGDYEITNLFASWDAKGQIAIQQRQPLPLTVTAIVPWVKVGDTPS